MDKPKIAAQVIANLKADPKKLYVFGLLLAVAVYFWVPLVGQFFGSSKHKDIPPQPLAMATMGTTQAPTQTRTSIPNPRSDPWHEIDEAISEDPRTKPSPDIPWKREPFEMLVEPAELVEEIGEDKPVEDVVDAQVQLLLKGTLVSTNKKTALINDESYQQGETIELADGFTVRLREVASRYVVLEANGVRVELLLDTPTTIELSQFKR